jgi:hypothetical protein
MKILVLANCQGRSIVQSLTANSRHDATYIAYGSKGEAALSKTFVDGFDLVIYQKKGGEIWNAIQDHRALMEFPFLQFFGMHPDQTSIASSTPGISVPWHNLSRIMACSWARGISQDETLRLFNPEFIDAMGYFGDYDTHRKIFISNLDRYLRNAEYLYDKWFDMGVFYFAAHHPRSHVVEDVSREICRNAGIEISHFTDDFFPDPLQEFAVNPNMNHPRARNLLTRPNHFYKLSRIIPADEMVRILFHQLDGAAEALTIHPGDLERFDTAYAAWAGRVPEPIENPYSRRPSSAFWSRAIVRPAIDEVRPGDGLRPIIDRTTKVATAGSCFAQHVARAMVSFGLNYYVAECAPVDVDAETANARGYGLFSARYGNIYSTRQLLQLIRRAWGRFTPVETAWEVEGGFIDPFRPNIGETFRSVAALEAARASHLAQVRRMFETLDVFVFTLGLTEGWVDRRDGAAFPVTPGAVTKSADPAHFEFLNLDYAAVKEDLIAFLGDLFAVNPGAQVILTVSPVPLIATYGKQDVLTATTYSKSVLRAAAGDVADLFDAVQYFPSYEIITGAFNRGEYFESDLRSVRSEGVTHVMQVFRERLVIGAQQEALTAESMSERSSTHEQIVEHIARQMQVVCDEELQVREVSV